MSDDVSFRDIYENAADRIGREHWELVEEVALRAELEEVGYASLLTSGELHNIDGWRHVDVSDDGEDPDPRWYFASGDEPRPEEFKRFHALLTENAPEGYTPHYFRVEPAGKDPATRFGSWKKPAARLSVEEAVDWMEAGGNVGIAGRGGCRGCGGRASDYCPQCEGDGHDDSLFNIDIDDEEETTPDDLEDTLRARSRSRGGWHAWGFDESGDIPNIPTDHAGEIRAQWQYVVAPGSFVASAAEEIPDDRLDDAGYYTVEAAQPVARMGYEDLPEVFRQADAADQGDGDDESALTRTGDTNDNGDRETETSAVFDIDAADLVSNSDPSDRFSSIFHGSTTDANMSVSQGKLHCWRHNVAHGGLQALATLNDDCPYGCGDLGKSHKRANAGANTLKDDWRLVWYAWREAKRRNLIPSDDQVPHRALVGWAVDNGVIDKSETTVQETEDGGTYVGFPSAEAYNDALDAVEEEDIEHNRELYATAEDSQPSEAGKAVADGGATTTASSGSGPGLDSGHPTADDVKAHLGVDEDETLADYSDREKAWAVWLSIRQSDEVHIRVKEQGKHASLWWYDDGIWQPGGETKLKKVAKRCLGNGRYYGPNVLSELEAQAYATEEVCKNHDEFGLPAGKIAVENGVVDLRDAYEDGDAQACRRLKPKDLALTRLPVRYEPDAESDHFSPFVDEVVEDGMVDAVQEYVGYCLHRGEMPHAKALMLVGSGANGKSTLLKVIRELLGGDITSTPLHRFENSHHAAELYGKIANIQGDLSSASLAGRAIGMFKQLTGDDLVSADEKYEDPFTFEPSAKHIYAANTTPDVSQYVDDSDTAWWRRWILVRFPNYYPEGSEQRDPDLAAKITGGRGYDGEMSAVLNWAIEGWGRLMDQGEFSDPDGPGGTRREWQRWGESLDEFLVDCVEPDPDGPNVTTGEAWDVYLAWCDEADKDPIDSQQKFTKRLKASGLDLGYGQSVYTTRHSPTNGYKRFGIDDDAPVSVADGLRHDDDQEDDDTDGDQRSLEDSAEAAADDQEDDDTDGDTVEAADDREAGAPDDAHEGSVEAARRELVAYLGARDGEAAVDDAVAALQLRGNFDEATAEAAVETAARDGRVIREGDVVRIG